MIATVVVVAIVAGSIYALAGISHTHGSSSNAVLTPKGDYYSIPGGQFNAVAFAAHQTSALTGEFTNTIGVTVYTMTPDELVAFAKSGVVAGYSWTSGRIANLTTTNLSLTIAPGQWDIVFLNPNGPGLYNTTVVGFYTALQLAPD